MKAREHKENEEIKQHSCHFSEATGSFARRKDLKVLYPEALMAPNRQAGPQHEGLLCVMQVYNKLITLHE